MDKLKNIKAVILDLDGTLLSPKLIMLPETKRTLLKLKEKGIKIIIASGRTPLIACSKTKELNINLPMILANGALIFDPNTNSIIDKTEMSKETISFFLKLSKEINNSLNIYTPKYIYLDENKIDSYILEAGDERCNLRSHDQLIIENEILLKCEFYGKDNGINPDLKYLVVEKSKHLGEDLYITSAHINYLEILNKNVNKHNGVVKVLKMLNLREDEVIAFGDSHNDLEMLANLPYSVAMGNASDEVKQAATYTTKSNNEDGIAYFIKNNTNIL
jgi:Cof subfamily protein (haloacid dehalogenase superfamily)